MDNTINGFVMVNKDKIDRAILGSPTRTGEYAGGLGEDADPELILAHYDKLAGYITKDGVKVKTGSFWDFKARAPRKEPQITFIYNIGGDKVEVEDPTKLADAVNTLNGIKVQKEVEFKEKKAKAAEKLNKN